MFISRNFLLSMEVNIVHQEKYHNNEFYPHCFLCTLIGRPAAGKYYWSACVVKGFSNHWVTRIHFVRVTVATIQL